MAFDPGTRNVFQITDPHTYRCQVWQYDSRLSRLSLRAYRALERDQAAFGLLFTDVAYWDGPMTWVSVDFHIAPHEDCIALMLETGLVGQAILQFPGAYASLTELARLFIVETAKRPVRLIASSGLVQTGG